MPSQISRMDTFVNVCSGLIQAVKDHNTLAALTIIGIIGLPWFREFNRASLEREERDMMIKSAEYRELKTKLAEISHKPPVEPEKLGEYIRQSIMSFHQSNHEASLKGWVSVVQPQISNKQTPLIENNVSEDH